MGAAFCRRRGNGKGFRTPRADRSRSRQVLAAVCTDAAARRGMAEHAGRRQEQVGDTLQRALESMQQDLGFSVPVRQGAIIAFYSKDL